MIHKSQHLGIYGVLEHDSKLLVVRKSRGPYRDLFDLPGGRPNHGEDLVTALRREVIEETGIVPLSASFLCPLSFVVPYTNAQCQPCELYHVALVYRIPTFDCDNFNPNTLHEDVQGALWIDRAKLSLKNSSMLLRAVINYFS